MLEPGLDIELGKQLAGASTKVDAVAVVGRDFAPGLTLEELAVIVDPRLKRRCLLAPPDAAFRTREDLASSEFAGQLREASETMAAAGWDVRLLNSLPSAACLAIDDAHAMIVGLEPLPSGTGDIYGGSGDDRLLEGEVTWIDGEAFGATFQRLWDTAPELELLYEEVFALWDPRVAERIVVASSDRWDRVIQHLAANPEKMMGMPSRRFEELVAELLVRDGMDVELTKKTRDGGRDILARADTSIGRHLFLVECKRYAADNPVGVRFVRALYGVVMLEGASAGAIVTTSRFTKGAADFQKEREHQLALEDYDKVVAWLKRSRSSN